MWVNGKESKSSYSGFGDSAFIVVYRLYFPGVQVQFPHLWYFKHITSEGETWVELLELLHRLYNLDLYILLLSYLNTHHQEQLSSGSTTEFNVTMNTHASHETTACFMVKWIEFVWETVLNLLSCLNQKQFSYILI